MKRNNSVTNYICSFCGKQQTQVQQLIAGPNHVYVCGECITNFTSEEHLMQDVHEPRKLACSFCSKQQNKVKYLIDGPKGVHICDECVDLCQEIVTEHARLVDGGDQE